LLLFCIILTVVSPVFNLVAVYSSFVLIAPYASDFPSLFAIDLVDSILTMALAGFGVYAGIQLWRVRPGAVRTAKTYLLSCLGYTVVALLLLGMAGEGAGMGTVLARNVIYVIVWHSYLNKSKRVQATYSQ